MQNSLVNGNINETLNWKCVGLFEYNRASGGTSGSVECLNSGVLAITPLIIGFVWFIHECNCFFFTRTLKTKISSYYC